MPKASTADEPVPDIGDQILTPDQVAAMLRVTRRHVTRTLYDQGRGPLRGFSIGRFIRFWLSDVLAYARARTEAATSKPFDGPAVVKLKKAKR